MEREEIINGVGTIVSYLEKNNINLETYFVPKYISDWLKGLVQNYIYHFFLVLVIKSFFLNVKITYPVSKEQINKFDDDFFQAWCL